MANLRIDNISEHVVAALKERAVKDSMTPEELARSILTAVARHWVVRKLPNSSDMTAIQASRLSEESEQVFALAEKQPLRIIDKKGGEFVLMTAKDYYFLGGIDVDGDV